MSSSSSANRQAPGASVAAVTINGLLSESFAVIAQELPAAMPGLVSGLAGSIIRLQVDDEVLEVSVAGETIMVEAQTARSPHAFIATSADVIDDVLEARLSLREAVLGGALRVLAPLERVEALHDVLIQYTHAAVRCPGFPELLARLKARPVANDSVEAAS